MSENRFHGVIGAVDASWPWPDSRLLAGAWTRIGRAGYAPLIVTMPRGDELAAALAARIAAR